MSFYIPTIGSCPVTREARGVIEIDPAIIEILSGAVHDPDEWLVILLGEKSKNGLHVVVDELYVPRTQLRTKATCSTTEPIPSGVAPYVVGVLHSHNNMSARFSGVDRGEDGLNRTFPMSIVIGSSFQVNDPAYAEYNLLGFAYEAEGRFTLPCGALGVAKFNIVPHGVEDWPMPAEVVIPSHSGEVHSLGDCQSWKEKDTSGKYFFSKRATCGLEETREHPRFSIFGLSGEYIISKLPKATVTHYKGQGKGGVTHFLPKGNKDSAADKRDEVIDLTSEYLGYEEYLYIDDDQYYKRNQRR